MLSKNAVPQTPCPVARSLNLIGDRWSLLIIRDAFDGIRRFRDFQKNLGVARNILSDRLRKLVEANILEMREASDGTAYQEYILTPEGENLFPIVVAFRQWGEKYLFEPNEPRSILVDKETGAEIGLMLPVSKDGKVLDAKATFVKKVVE
ncbi:winged helix-turn-helix transcriptional regulator [Providencia vermicola]|uniref:winged helix-turn-helix transcriptional regulator n=1 Tax=Providencia vermicola TaxID=333965 RepID=UPI0034D50BA5